MTKLFDDHFGELVAIDCLEQGNDYVVVSMMLVINLYVSYLINIAAQLYQRQF